MAERPRKHPPHDTASLSLRHVLFGGGLFDNASAHPNGRYVCYQLTQSRCDLTTTTKPVIAEKTCSVIVWTDYSEKMVVTAEQPTREQAKLASFFSHWIHPRG